MTEQDIRQQRTSVNFTVTEATTNSGLVMPSLPAIEEPMTATEKEVKHYEIGEWHPENWDAFTLHYLHSPDGAGLLKLLQSVPELKKQNAALLAAAEALYLSLREYTDERSTPAQDAVLTSAEAAIAAAR